MTTLDSLAKYVISLKATPTNRASSPTKKRKLEEDSNGVGGSVLFDFKDISFSVPVRKKLRLEGLRGGIKAVDASGNAEVNIAWDSIGRPFNKHCMRFSQEGVADMLLAKNTFFVYQCPIAPNHSTTLS